MTPTRKKVWVNKKYKNKSYVGSYAPISAHKGTDGRPQRVFVLMCILVTGQAHALTFESHEAAKREGWRKSMTA